VPVDPNSLPEDPAILKQMLLDVTTQLDKTQRLLRQLLEAKSGTQRTVERRSVTVIRAGTQRC
jgi:hypothetical protein